MWGRQDRSQCRGILIGLENDLPAVDSLVWLNGALHLNEYINISLPILTESFHIFDQLNWDHFPVYKKWGWQAVTVMRMMTPSRPHRHMFFDFIIPSHNFLSELLMPPILTFLFLLSSRLTSIFNYKSTKWCEGPEKWVLKNCQYTAKSIIFPVSTLERTKVMAVFLHFSYFFMYVFAF